MDMTLIKILLLVATSGGAPTAHAKPPPKVHTRCGWVDNPTPGNFSLHDREGEWVLAEQGGYQAKGIDLIPDLSGNEFVEQNGHHGYACACLTVAVDATSHRVVTLTHVKQKLLKACLEDPALPPMPRTAR